MYIKIKRQIDLDLHRGRAYMEGSIQGRGHLYPPPPFEIHEKKKKQGRKGTKMSEKETNKKNKRK